MAVQCDGGGGSGRVGADPAWGVSRAAVNAKWSGLGN